MSSLPRCPYCGHQTRYGTRDSWSLSMGETPLDCTDGCARKNVGYRDHDSGDFVMDRTSRSEQST